MVLRHLAQVHLALGDHSGYSGELLTRLYLTLSERSAALDWIAQVNAVAVRVGGRGQQLAIIESLLSNARYWIIKEDFLYRSRMCSQLCCYFCYYYYLP